MPPRKGRSGRAKPTSGPWHVFGTYLILSAFAHLLVVQVTDATAVGVTYGRGTQCSADHYCEGVRERLSVLSCLSSVVPWFSISQTVLFATA